MGVKYWTINLVIVLITGVGGLRDVEIRAPLAVAPGKSATLICRYDLEGDPLYTVKWYKGRQEFFRYVPKELPHTRVFPLPGINVDINASGPDRVVLRDVQKELSGKYRCEVSADAPNFHTQVVSTQMHVVNQLEEEPTIFIEKRRYAVGETIRGNCTGPPSNPAANITWTINSHKIKSSYIKRMPLSSGEEAKVLTSAGLEFEVTITSFQGGKLSLVCTADVYQVHWKQTRIVIEEERPRLASVMGTRDTNTGGRPSWTSVLPILPLAVLISR